MSKRPEGYKPKPANEHRPVAPPVAPKPEPPRTLADVAKLPRDERIALLRREVAAIEAHIVQAQQDLAHARGLLAAAEAF